MNYALIAVESNRGWGWDVVQVDLATDAREIVDTGYRSYEGALSGIKEMRRKQKVAA